MADLVRLRLGTVIAQFIEAKRAYDTAAEAGDTDGPEWDAYETKEHAVIVYPCLTIEDVRQKARFFLDYAGPNDTLRNCYSGDYDWTLDEFLRSLLGEAQP